MKKVFVCMAAAAISVSLTAQVKTKPAVRPAVKMAVKPNVAAMGIKTSLDSLAYAIGVNISGSLQQQGLDKINTNLLQKGLTDGLKSKPAIDPQQCNNVIQTYMVALQQKMQASAMVKVNEEKARAATFLEANKKRPGVMVLSDGLQYEILKKGNDSGPMPTLSDTIVVNYAGTLTDGSKFDNSYDRGEPLVRPMTGVVRGWTEVLQLMHVGDKFKVYIPSDLGYGDRGAGGGAIPGGAVLVFEMELMAIRPGTSH